jgi:hypothetical protein
MPTDRVQTIVFPSDHSAHLIRSRAGAPAHKILSIARDPGIVATASEDGPAQVPAAVHPLLFEGVRPAG